MQKPLFLQCLFKCHKLDILMTITLLILCMSSNFGNNEFPNNCYVFQSIYVYLCVDIRVFLPLLDSPSCYYISKNLIHLCIKPHYMMGPYISANTLVCLKSIPYTCGRTLFQLYYCDLSKMEDVKMNLYLSFPL